MVQYRPKDGKMKRCHKEYVDVLLRNTSSGRLVPFAVCWVDGRVFGIDEIVEERSRDAEYAGSWNKRYRVRFGSHETEIYLEHVDGGEKGDCLRWWVYAIDKAA